MSIYIAPSSGDFSLLSPRRAIIAIMGLFSKKQKPINSYAGMADSAALAQRALDFIAEGVLLIDAGGMIQFANPAAATMTGYDSSTMLTGLDYSLILRLESADGAPIEISKTDIYTAIKTNQPLTSRKYLLVSAQAEHRMAIALSVIPTGGTHDFKIITFRDITKELQEENEQAEFISTASHEMRTPVASIEGYLGLALNPQTATIDARAKQYLEAAHSASQHLGRLFKDLLDVTKLDDKRLKAHPVPVDAVEVVQKLAATHEKEFMAKNLHYTFGANEPTGGFDKKHIEPKVYMAVDLDFLREILDNLIGNAIKYTPAGGQIWVNVRGDGDKVLINVTDTGIGISAEDAAHVFQKFYRVDNSQTRQIGGTGLGLYLVKQRVEALHGRVWLESAFGQGSTFFVSLPRLSASEYERMSIAEANQRMIQQFSAAPAQPAQSAPAAKPAAMPTPAAQPVAMPIPNSQTIAQAVAAVGPAAPRPGILTSGSITQQGGTQ